MRKNKIQNFTWLIDKSHQQSITEINWRTKSLTKSLKIIKGLTNNQGPNQIIRSLTSKMRFFELFIKKIKTNYIRTLFAGNLSKRGWIDGLCDGSSWSRWTVMDSVIQYLMQFLLLLSSLPSTASMTDRHRHNGPSRVFVPKHFNYWNMGTGITSLNFMTNLQDGPSQTS